MCRLSVGSATRLMAKAIMTIIKGEVGSGLATWSRESKAYSLRRDIARAKIDLKREAEERVQEVIVTLAPQLDLFTHLCARQRKASKKSDENSEQKPRARC